MIRRWLLCVVVGWAGAAAADGGSEPLSWLQRMATAARSLSYAGTFVYQTASSTETSRITHIVDASGERERVEVLDGSPREIVRQNDEVQCFLPQQRTVIIDRQMQRAVFPARLPAALSGLTDFYTVRKGDVSRVAGLDSQLITLEPKDKLRYGHELWADIASGLLLKARIVNEKGDTVEQFAFTQVQIGNVGDRDAVRSKYTARDSGWKIQKGWAVEASAEESSWQFREVPGFRRQVGMVRQLRENAPEVVHVVFSDGLAAVSVFIEPLRGDTGAQAAGLYSAGPVNVYKRRVGDHLVTVLGEVPPQTLVRVGDGVQPRKR